MLCVCVVHDPPALTAVPITLSNILLFFFCKGIIELIESLLVLAFVLLLQSHPGI